jgi:Ca-activated chloride channel homolog
MRIAALSDASPHAGMGPAPLQRAETRAMPRIPFRPLASTSRFILHVVLAALAAWLLVVGSPALAADLQGPRLQARTGNPAQAGLVLKATRVDVDIAGMMAEVTVTQHYRHEGLRAVDADYVFAGSPRAAVHAVTVQLGERVLDTRIQARPRLRIEGFAARQGGQEPPPPQEPLQGGLRDVAGIQPGDDVRVELRYTELLIPSEGRYRFVFPQVTGAPQRTPAAFDVHLHLGAPLPVAAIESPSHRIEVSGEDSTQAEVMLADPGDRDARDFVLDYRLGGERTAAGLMLYRGEEENFFLALAAPPVAVESAQRRAREFVFVVGVSDTAQSEPLLAARAVLRELIGGLRPDDRFGVMQFSGDRLGLGEALTLASQAQVGRALKAVERLRGGGGADLAPALRRMATLPRDPEAARSVVIVTDGRVAVEGDMLRRVRKIVGGAHLFAIGVGASANQPLVEGLARAGWGEPFRVERPEAAAAQAARLRALVDAPLLTQLNARFVGLDVYDVEAAPWPDLLAGRPVWVSGKWRAADEAGAPQGLLVLEGRAAGGTFRDLVRAPAPDPRAGALRQIWARQRLQQLSDQEALEGGHARRDEITALGLKYGMATSYTGFPAGAAPARGHPWPVLAPLVPAEPPAPARRAGMPEPGTWALLGAASLLTLWGVGRRSRAGGGHEPARPPEGRIPECMARRVAQ